MKQIDIPHMSALQGCSAEEAYQLLAEAGAEISIEEVNWPALYPACPQTRVRAAHSEDTLYLRYEVRGNGLRAVVDEDQGEVWCDSCVEFFCQEEGAAHYYNIETNCIGRIVASRRRSRNEDIVRFTPEQLAQIDRYATEGTEAFGSKEGPQHWGVAIAIPLALLVEKVTFPMTLRGNFYKCADKAEEVHYVSWNKIETKTPDFHCPAYFGKIVLRVEG